MFKTYIALPRLYKNEGEYTRSSNRETVVSLQISTIFSLKCSPGSGILAVGFIPKLEVQSAVIVRKLLQQKSIHIKTKKQA